MGMICSASAGQIMFSLGIFGLALDFSIANYIIGSGPVGPILFLSSSSSAIPNVL